jgi:hypothetical protein
MSVNTVYLFIKLCVDRRNSGHARNLKQQDEENMSKTVAT